MWLVTGIDEEHRFREWADAAAFYRLIVEDWVATNGGKAEGVDDLRPGDTRQIQFSTGTGEKVRFGLTWDVGGGRMDHFVAC